MRRSSGGLGVLGEHFEISLASKMRVEDLELGLADFPRPVLLDESA